MSGPSSVLTPEISNPLFAVPAPPLVSLARAASTAPSSGLDPSRAGKKGSQNLESVSKALERARGGETQDYRIDDVSDKTCFQCGSAIAPWTEKHYCRVCGHVFCPRCASNTIKRPCRGLTEAVCNMCFQNLAMSSEGDNLRQFESSTTSVLLGRPVPTSLISDHRLQSAFADSQLLGAMDDTLSLQSMPDTQTTLSPQHGHGKDTLRRQRSWLTFIRGSAFNRPDSAAADTPGSQKAIEDTIVREAQQLKLESMGYLKLFLQQMLSREEIHNVHEWMDILLKFALRATRELVPTDSPHGQGHDMDIRRFVMIKKIPGGVPQDSEYIDGAVITKSLADSQMSVFKANPRIMLVTFPLERSQMKEQLMQTIHPEKEILDSIVKSVALLRPHVVLAEMPFSRMAIDTFSKHNISVARTVKLSSIQKVARLTQGDIFSSPDQLVQECRLGHCALFRTQAYEHDLIPGCRKTYMRFEGCNPNMGCTIILRGGEIDTLRRIKKVARFLIFLVRNLKLETYLWDDSVTALPLVDAHAAPIPYTLQTSHSSSLFSFPPKPTFTTPGSETSEHASDSVCTEGEGAIQTGLSRRIRQLSELYTNTFISLSATLRFPAPQPVQRMKELDDELIKLKTTWEDEVIARHGSSEPTQGAAIAPTITLSSVHTSGDQIDSETQILPLTVKPGENGLANVNDGSSVTMRTVSDIAPESRLSLVMWKHEEQRRIWEWYMRKNKDDFILEHYQHIILREYAVPIADFGLHHACFTPQLTYIAFYGENDCTLGQYIEKSLTDTLSQLQDPEAICSGNGCNQPLARHCKVYVHNETRLFVAVEECDERICDPPVDLITWGVCRVCGTATPVIPVSEELQRYSFAKFLELHFYPADVKLTRNSGCQHNLYQHYIRYFASKGMALRFQAETVTLLEVVYPPTRIRVCSENQLELKNADFNHLQSRNSMWYATLVDDLELISTHIASGKCEEADGQPIVDISKLILRAHAEKEDVSCLTNQIYRDSSPTDTLALNKVWSYRRDKIISWQLDFDRLPELQPPLAFEGHGSRTPTVRRGRAGWTKSHDARYALDNPYLYSSKSRGGTSPMDTTAIGASSRVNTKQIDSDAVGGFSYDSGTSPMTLKPRLPKRPVRPLNEAELVKAYRDASPSGRIQEFTKTSSFSRHTTHNASQRSVQPGAFAPQSYAAMIAPSYLTRSGGSPGQTLKDGSESDETRTALGPGRSAVTPYNKHEKGRTAIRPKANFNHPSNPGTNPRPPSNPTSKVSDIARHFGDMDRENKTANYRYALLRRKRARPLASARAKVEVLGSIRDAIEDDSESSDSSGAEDSDGDSDGDYWSPNENIATDSPNADAELSLGNVSAKPLPHSSSGDLSSQLEGPGAQPPRWSAMQSPSLKVSSSGQGIGSRGVGSASMSKALSSFALRPSLQSHHRDQIFESDIFELEHTFRDSSVVVRTDEPTSIIALALDSSQYRDILAKSLKDNPRAREPKPPSEGIANSNSSESWFIGKGSPEFPNPVEELRSPLSKHPWSISWESGELAISCTILYPEKFDALRRAYDCENVMIESLARCVRWNDNRNQPASAFLKTRDDRFIVRLLSKQELQTMERFCPAYFLYMSSAISTNRPTLLAKVFGCYRISFDYTDAGKKSGKPKATQMNLLVMENIFFDRSFSKIYELNGNKDNRDLHIRREGKEYEVLRDGHLVQTAHLNPFYLREHSKRILRGAIYNDCTFLADLGIMEYTLVVGVDSKHNELVVGIVDFVQMYSWDRKLELWVGLAIGSAPEQYKLRMISAMEEYFPLVPDRWMKKRDTAPQDVNPSLKLWPDW